MTEHTAQTPGPPSTAATMSRSRDSQIDLLLRLSESPQLAGDFAVPSYRRRPVHLQKDADRVAHTFLGTASMAGAYLRRPEAMADLELHDYALAQLLMATYEHLSVDVTVKTPHNWPVIIAVAFDPRGVGLGPVLGPFVRWTEGPADPDFRSEIAESLRKALMASAGADREIDEAWTEAFLSACRRRVQALRSA